MLKKFLIALVLVCAGFAGHATTDIQPNGNLAGGNTAANCTQPVLGTYSGSTNFEAKWRANSVPLRWYDQGTPLDVQDAADTCTYDGVLNIPSNPPSRTGYTFGGWKVRSLPAGYTELEYIETTGTQYINTGITGPAIWRITAQSQVVSGSQNTVLIANGNSGPAFFGALSNGKWGAGTGATNYYSNVENTTKMNAVINFANASIISGTVNSSSFQRIGDNIFMDSPYIIFSISSNFFFKGKLYIATCTQNGSFVRYFVPAKNSSNVVGLYDMVSGTFFTNSGTGTFTAGPALN